MTSTRSDINISARLTSISQIIAATAISVGVLVLIGWMLRLPGLSRIHPTLGTMGSHTALSFGLAGMALLLSRGDPPYGWRRRAAQGLASLVVAMSWLTLSQWYGWGIGIDQFFQGTIGAMLPGRMPVATSLVFLAFGLAVLLLDVEMGRWRPAEFLSFAASLIGLLAFIAYGYSFVSVFEISNRRPLAFHTVLLLLAFSFAVLAARPQRGLMSLATGSGISGVVVRRMLPAAVGIPVLMGWLIMDGQRGRLYPPALSLPYYTLSIIVIFSTLIWLTAASLQRIDLRRQKAEEQVRQLNAELEQRVVERTAQLESANRELEAFSYSVSHDLRAPLRAIDGFSSIVLQDHSEALGPRGEDHLQRVCAASRRMGQLIDDLLSLSRVTRNEMRRQTVDLSEMVEETVADLRGREPERSVHVCIEPNLRADADPNLIRIVLENLLGNAWKFTRRKSDPRIEIGTVSHDGRNAFFVRDNGAGFDMAYADKLFAAFQRLHGPADFEGTGIGLATVQRIIARHGGQVRAEGSVGQGATFYFSL